MPGFPSRAFLRSRPRHILYRHLIGASPMSKAKGFHCLLHSSVLSLKQTAYHITNQRRSLRHTTATALG